MILNSDKKYILFLFLGLSLLSIGQEEKTNRWKKYHYDVLGEVWIGYLNPQFYGDNFLAKAFDVGEGVVLGINGLPDHKWYAGVQFSSFRGNVSNTSRVGFFDSSRIQQIYVTGGYSFSKKESRFSMKGGVGFGYVDLRNERNFERFRDNGFTVMGGLTFSYRLNTFFGLYALLQHQWYFLDIDVPPEERSFFRTVTLFAPSVGIKFSFL
nr:hypothetical protein [uncultured Allomuricauda sp.]